MDAFHENVGRADLWGTSTLTLGCDVIVWCRHRPVRVEAGRLKR
ncbi:MAG: hypothetical protein AVDCRST_MAG64-3431 [uncultured Phycisphaerae bacterium]|uniref:Uncharacterized protein n=1 Tax=uncultured Phycisphaerae bacterium TaxID=904963 RepID=A0A6J4PYV5_9BACT|nr:MAG: hypothetical protein AVDCRST_MAG64-3431 [uncultured Phycisphaerae bacterium]